ncbi:heavy-metal-associated domain-containing protein, partial [Saccharomonospora halophila]|uniref:heavy-metal-associated domain-containing protein n=1 Tax=Saccharomonospora halophila TaxID=129922 RepID=UPI00048BB2F2
MNVFGLPVPGPLTVVGTALGTARGVASVASRPRRHVWSSPGRHYIEVHGVHGAQGPSVARRIEAAVEAHPGVRWARVNAPSSRVVVALSDPGLRSAPLVDRV